MDAEQSNTYVTKQDEDSKAQRTRETHENIIVICRATEQIKRQTSTQPGRGRKNTEQKSDAPRRR